MFSINKVPEIPEKLAALAESAKYDVCLATCSSGADGRKGRSRSLKNPLTEWIYPASVPGQGTVHILKILQSNSCRNNCRYCHFAGNNTGLRRVSMSPEELASAFMLLVRSRLVEGIFISSGICRSAALTMENIVRTAEILRLRYRFGGYIHLKVIPGCSADLIDAAAKYANRLSINLEAPSARHLQTIAPEKDLYRDIVPAAKKIAALLEKRANGDTSGIRAVSQTTQFVVGAADESDMDILNTVDFLYRDLYMFRAYFSAFQNTTVENRIGNPTGNKAFAGSPLLREHRLYQCDFLMRAYGFRFPDLIFDGTGNIPLETDPKTAWAVMHPEYFPVEINTASEEELLRVPGIGPVSAERIISMRRKCRMTGTGDLKAAGAWAGRASGWIEINGKSPDAGENREPFFNPSQKWLFEELAPEGWRKAGRQKPLIETNGSTEGKNNAGEKGKETEKIEYPAQKGKWVNSRLKQSDPKIMCR